MKMKEQITRDLKNSFLLNRLGRDLYNDRGPSNSVERYSLMMDPTLERHKGLSDSAKMNLMDAIVVFPNTESIQSNIKREEKL